MTSAASACSAVNEVTPAAYRRVLEQVRETGASDRMGEFTDLPGGYPT